MQHLLPLHLFRHLVINYKTRLSLLLFLFCFQSSHAMHPPPETAPAHKTGSKELTVTNSLPGEKNMSYDLDARSALGVTATLTEHYLKHALTALRLIAATPATRSGIWPEIRPALLTLTEAIPGAALYIEPDGNYYSVERGYTGLNLSDRDYFDRLFRGQEVHGSLIYSRSTGKQSVFMAVPVIEQENVTGAVALSVFLEDFQQLITESLDLPPDYLWYVIDEEASTVLHPRSDFVFMNPAEQGSPSLKQAVETIISNDHGYTSYVFAGRNTHVLFTKLDFNNWRVILGKIGEKVEDDYMPKAYEILNSIKNVISKQLKEMDQNLHEAVSTFNGSFPPEHTARNTFRQIYKENPFVVNCALIDVDGVMVYLEPYDFHPSEGQDIRDQENFFAMQKNRAPMLSSSFWATEGFDAVSLHHPILDQDGNFHGSVNLLIRPEVMVEELVTPYIAETIYDPWVMEPEGRIIFDKALDGTGRMLFLDYRFDEKRTLLELGDQITEQRAGQGDYIFTDPETQAKVIKMAIWDTVELHNTQWRVILSYPPYD